MDWVLMVFLWGAQPSVSFERFEHREECETVQAVAKAAPADAGQSARITAYCVHTGVGVVTGVRPTVIK